MHYEIYYRYTEQQKTLVKAIFCKIQILPTSDFKYGPKFNTSFRYA